MVGRRGGRTSPSKPILGSEGSYAEKNKTQAKKGAVEVVSGWAKGTEISPPKPILGS